MILNKLKQKILDTILKPKPCEPDKNKCYTHFDSCYIPFNSSPPPKRSSQQNEATLAGRIGNIEVDLTLKEKEIETKTTGKVGKHSVNLTEKRTDLTTTTIGKITNQHSTEKVEITIDSN